MQSLWGLLGWRWQRVRQAMHQIEDNRHRDDILFQRHNTGGLQNLHAMVSGRRQNLYECLISTGFGQEVLLHQGDAWQFLEG